MPIYEYKCAACGKVTEMLQKFSDPAPSKCEACGSGPLDKLMSQTSFVLQGTGWYVTDFKGGKKSDSKGSGGSPKGSTEGSPKGSSEGSSGGGSPGE
jgi:putative FmdB family regulatory protein